MICCTKLVFRDCPKCDIGDITNRVNPASSSTNTTKPNTTEFRVREEELSKDQENTTTATTAAATTSNTAIPSSNVTELTNKPYPDGLFTGLVKGCQRHKGTLVYHANDANKRKEYQGDFLNDLPHGKGKYTGANGDVYEGDFKSDKKEGRGKYTWANGDVFEGDYKNDKKEGRGKYTWANGDVYEGDYKNDKDVSDWESGLDAKNTEFDIELVTKQAQCSRAQAIKALKNSDGDLVDAIMELTMYK